MNSLCKAHDAAASGSGCFQLQAFPPLVTAPSFHGGLVYPAPSGRDRNCKDSVAPAYWTLGKLGPVQMVPPPPLNMIKHFPRTKAR